MSLAELLIDFVPRDAYLIYALVSKEWLRLWKLRQFPTESNAIHFVESMDLVNIAAGSPQRILVNAAVRRGTIEIISMLYESTPREFCELSCAIAALRGRLDILQWLHANGCPWDEMTCDYAAKEGHLEILMWARENCCPWDAWTCAHAAESDNLDILQWLRANGCPWDWRTCAYAAENGHFEILMWARQNGCPWDE